jgi:hypothetical protein
VKSSDLVWLAFALALFALGLAAAFGKVPPA